MENIRLKATLKRIFEVNDGDFDNFVRSIYGGNFEFVADHEANNNSQYEFTAPNMNRDFDGKYEAKIREGKFNGVPVHALFNVLHKDGHLPEGTYVIKVSW